MNARLKALTTTTLAALGITQAADSEPAAPVVVEGEVVDEPAGEPADPAPADEAAAEAEAAAADAEVAAAITLAATESATKATAAANARWAGVLGSEEAKGRTAQAVTLLGNTNLDAAAIKTTLAAFPKEVAAGFAARMAEAPNPAITAGAGESDAKAENHGWGKVRAKNSRTTAAK